MSFSNPYFLFGLAGIAAPVLIHLLTRDQVKKVAFSTLRFFEKGAKVVVQRKRFQELLLILMRVALVALLAIVFARPFFGSDPAASGGVEKARAVLVDVSGSMRREGLPEAAKKAAGDALKGADAISLVTFSDTTNLLETFGATKESLQAAADQLQPGYGATRIADALRRANDLLRGTVARSKEIVLISDFERAGWSPENAKLDPGIKLSVQPLQPKDSGGGAAIVQADAPNSLILDNQPSSITVRIANFSDQPRQDLEVTLSLDGKKVESQKVNVPAGRSVAARFRHVFDTPGDHLGTVSIGTGEPFYFNARTIPRIPVLLVNGNPSANPREDAAFFIEKALSPTEESPFAVQVLSADKVTPADVAAVSVVILANVGEVLPPVAAALTELLARGGGLMFFAGDQAKPDKFNAVFENLAPFKLRQVLQARPADGETAESLSKIDYEHPIFSVFAAPHHGNLSLPKFARYWETTDTQRSRVLARFGDGRPAILDREIGKGTSLAIMSAPATDWNDLPYQSVFLPLVHQCMRYLAAQTGQRTNYSVGEVVPVPEGCKLKGPDGGDSVSAPGFYSIVNKDGVVQSQLAVNAALSESDPAIIAPEELMASVETPATDALVSLSASGFPDAGKAGSATGNLWWFLLCGVVILSAAELSLANRTVRH
jgi:hypothetical protein